MTIRGWHKKYTEILKEFQFSQKEDKKSAIILNSLIKNPTSNKKLERKIYAKTVFVVGAGPTLSKSIPILKKYKDATIIVADGATKALIENKIIPSVVVTDLDGDQESLKKVGKSNSIMLVHAHGDNISKLPMVKNFKNCIGTTETKSFSRIQNFGGFTDGDRCVFVAHHFGAKNIILFGMDFGKKIGKYSKKKILNKKIKAKKLRRAQKLIEWLAAKKNSNFYTTSKSIKGFEKISYKDIDSIIS